MVTIKDGRKIRDTLFVKPEEMLGNKNHAAERPISLVIDAKMRFPTLPPLIPYHPAMNKRIEIEKLARFLDQMFVTDWNLHRHFLESTRKEDQVNRIEYRKTQENNASDSHSEQIVLNELDRRIFYFKRALKNMLRQKDVNADQRKDMLSIFDQLRKLTVERYEKYTIDTRKQIKVGQREHENYWRFRLDNLWSGSSTGGVSKLKNHGNKIEEVTGKIDHKEKAKITEEHWDWRKDNGYIALPNGGMAHSSAGNGKTPETMAAEVHAPLIDTRINNFLDWRASSSYVTTPNNSLVHLKNQGLQPEGAIAAINQPKKEQVTEDHREHYRWNMSGPTPNGGFAPLYNSGSKPEAVKADVWWPIRQDITNDINHWQHNYLFKPTGNGGWQILEGVGKSVAHTAAMVDQPKKEKVTQDHEIWRKNNMWSVTPNNGYARLANVGSSIEKITAKHFEPQKEAMHQYHEQRSLNDRYVQTPNQGWRKLKGIGADLEKITGDADTVHNVKIGEFYDQRAKNNLYAPTGNDGIGRLPNIGQSIEKTMHDALAPNKEMSPTNVKQFVHNQADTSVDRGQGSPQGSNGRASEEAAAKTAAKTPDGKKNSFQEFKKSLAAHDQSTSAFSAHTNTPSTSDTGAKPAVAAVPSGASNKKAG